MKKQKYLSKIHWEDCVSVWSLATKEKLRYCKKGDEGKLFVFARFPALHKVVLPGEFTAKTAKYASMLNCII